MSFDWRGLIGTVAPTIASAFGTPLAGMATSAICQALGLTPKANDDENSTMIAAKLAGATPADLLALKTAEEQFQKDMKSLDIDLERLVVGDRASARDAATKLAQAGIKNYTIPMLIAAAFITLIVLFVWVWLQPAIPEFAKGIISLAIGRFLGYLDQAYSFEFGSTRQSHINQAAMSVAIQKESNN